MFIIMMDCLLFVNANSFCWQHEQGAKWHEDCPLSSSSSQLVLSGLAPFTSYTVCVATQTRGPLGNYSSDQLAMTQGDGEAVYLDTYFL